MNSSKNPLFVSLFTLASVLSGCFLTETVYATKNSIVGLTKIIANTVKGRGVSFMEDDNNWHYKIPNELEVNKSKKELIVGTSL